MLKILIEKIRFKDRLLRSQKTVEKGRNERKKSNAYH